MACLRWTPVPHPCAVENNAMGQWHRVVEVERLAPGTCGEFVVGQRIVALFHVEGQFYALDGICPHQGGPLGKGALNGPVVTCPWHGFQFDVRTGQHLTSRTLVQPSFPTKVEAGAVWVDLPE
jgi:nitrite reductase/ring-hydroxylating ferredoxin subunit